MNELDKVAESLFDKIRSRFEPITLGDSKAKQTDDPSQARFFNFDYTSRDGKNFGNITISLTDDDRSLKIYFGRNVTEEMTDEEQNEWSVFLRSLKKFSRRNMLKSCDMHDISRGALDSKSIRQTAKSSSSYKASDISPVTESQLFGTTRTSYQVLGPTRLIVRHSQKVDEEILGARTRKIESVFVETAEGERFKLPFNNLHGARAMARHVASGGTMTDDISAYITETVTELGAMSCFVRAMQHRVFEDSETIKMLEAAKHRYVKLKKDLKSWSGPRGYSSYFGDWSSGGPGVTEAADVDELRERFTKKIFDDRLMDALPYVQRAYQEYQMNETKMSQEFEQWADNMVETIGAGPANDQDVQQLRTLFQAELPAGIDGEQAIAAVGDLIADTSLHDNLYQLGKIAGSSADARPVIYKWVEDNRPDLADKMDYTPDESATMSVQPASSTSQAAPAATPNAVPTESIQTEADESIDFIRYLAGLR